MMFLGCLAILGSFALVHGGEEKKQQVIILLGPPGSGKGTQAKRITQELKLPHISTGDLFRAMMNDESDLAKRIKSFMNAGNLVPDELVNEMAFERISQPDCAAGYILDGYPRTISQVEELDRQLPAHAELHVINIDVSGEVVIKRIAGRLSCGKCGAVYNKYFSPPSQEGICDKCKSKLVSRPDDQPEVVRDRLDVYHEQTEPLIEYYRKKGNMLEVDGEQDSDAITKQILSNL